jgi:Na+/melibiose symporter-like transporter
MRHKSTLPGMPVLVASYFVYGWTSHFKTNVAGPVVALFFAGFSISFMYSSTLVYLVDSNPGRSSSAVSCNSFCRGVSACVMSQVAIPIQNAIGDGGLYSLFGGILCIACAGITLIACKLKTVEEKGRERS